eukprot:1515507-Prymnesium_polylepis.1
MHHHASQRASRLASGDVLFIRLFPALCVSSEGGRLAARAAAAAMPAAALPAADRGVTRASSAPSVTTPTGPAAAARFARQFNLHNVRLPSR